MKFIDEFIVIMIFMPRVCMRSEVYGSVFVCVCVCVFVCAPHIIIYALIIWSGGVSLT